MSIAEPAPAPPLEEERPRKLEFLEDALRRSPAGARLADEIARHAEEVIRLINHERRVAATWRRNQGPAFIRAAVDSGFVEDVRIPREVNGVRMEELLLRMADALQRHGGPELRRTIAERALVTLRWARECESLRDLFRVLETMEGEVAA